MERTVNAQKTFDLLALASKDLPLARQQILPDLVAEDLAVEILLIGLDHPNTAIADLAGELMLAHFPGKLREPYLVRLMNSGNPTTAYRAAEVRIKNFPDRIENATLRAYAHKHRCAAVRAAAEIVLDARAEEAFMRSFERRLAAEAR